MVAEKMRTMGLAQYLGAVGGDAYLAGLVAECSYLGADNASAHAKLVLDAARRRAVILASAQLVEKAYSGELTSAQLVEQFKANSERWQIGAMPRCPALSGAPERGNTADRSAMGRPKQVRGERNPDRPDRR